MSEQSPLAMLHEAESRLRSVSNGIEHKAEALCTSGNVTLGYQLSLEAQELWEIADLVRKGAHSWVDQDVQRCLASDRAKLELAFVMSEFCGKEESHGETPE